MDPARKRLYYDKLSLVPVSPYIRQTCQLLTFTLTLKLIIDGHRLHYTATVIFQQKLQVMVNESEGLGFCPWGDYFLRGLYPQWFFRFPGRSCLQTGNGSCICKKKSESVHFRLQFAVRRTHLLHSSRRESCIVWPDRCLRV